MFSDFFLFSVHIINVLIISVHVEVTILQKIQFETNPKFNFMLIPVIWHDNNNLNSLFCNPYSLTHCWLYWYLLVFHFP
jgi:hypothetical protein